MRRPYRLRLPGPTAVPERVRQALTRPVVNHRGPEFGAVVREIGAAYRERIGKHFPAMALLGVAELFDPEAMIEIEGLAYVG